MMSDCQNETQAKEEINVINVKVMLINTLIRAAAILTDLNDEANKNIILDIAEYYLSNAKQEYVEKLDEDVISIIDDVKSSL